MIERHLLRYLLKWKKDPARLPMLIQGARQVGKTTLVRQFSTQFDHYIELNLEKQKDRRLFELYDNIENLVEAIFLQKGIAYTTTTSCLLFIDEIQDWPPAISLLRYFHEDYPAIYVIASGSLLSFALKDQPSVPVGRLDYQTLHPLSFSEYLGAIGATPLLEEYYKVPLRDVAIAPLMEHFHRYTLIGGMPRIVASYIQYRDLSKLQTLYRSLMRGYQDDVEKYARNRTEVNVIRHIIKVSPGMTDQRITFEKFGHSEYRAREVGEAFRSLEKARIIDLIYPTTQTSIPVIQDNRKRPRLLFLDVGLLNFSAGIQQELIAINDLNDISRGRTVQQVIYQEIRAAAIEPDEDYSFWVRQERRAQAEVDLVLPYNIYLIPIEMKSGKSGKLRSLHEYMDRCDHQYAVRLYAGKMRKDKVKTRKGKKFLLLSLPYCLAGNLTQYLAWFIDEGSK